MDPTCWQDVKLMVAAVCVGCVLLVFTMTTSETEVCLDTQDFIADHLFTMFLDGDTLL